MGSGYQLKKYMSINKITSVALAIIGVVVFTLGILLTASMHTFAGDGGVNALDCDAVATTTLTIGDDKETLIVAENARNAYVIVQQPLFATNTVALGFGATSSVTASGFILASAPSASATATPDQIVFGLNTDFPFVGNVYARTNAASTTLGVTVCRYTN